MKMINELEFFVQYVKGEYSIETLCQYTSLLA